jgi:hypothetical protein
MELEFPVINEEELQTLIVSVNPVRLGNNPICFTNDDIKEIYIQL